MWFHFISHDFDLISFDLTWFQFDFTWFHFDFTWFPYCPKGKWNYCQKGKGKGSRAEREKGKWHDIILGRDLTRQRHRAHARTTRNDFPVWTHPPTSDRFKPKAYGFCFSRPAPSLRSCSHQWPHVGHLKKSITAMPSSMGHESGCSQASRATPWASQACPNWKSIKWTSEPKIEKPGPKSKNPV